jgi:hypothetical protein
VTTVGASEESHGKVRMLKSFVTSQLTPWLLGITYVGGSAAMPNKDKYTS